MFMCVQHRGTPRLLSWPTTIIIIIIITTTTLLYYLFLLRNTIIRRCNENVNESKTLRTLRATANKGHALLSAIFTRPNGYDDTRRKIVFLVDKGRTWSL